MPYSRQSNYRTLGLFLIVLSATMGFSPAPLQAQNVNELIVFAQPFGAAITTAKVSPVGVCTTANPCTGFPSGAGIQNKSQGGHVLVVYVPTAVADVTPVQIRIEASYTCPNPPLCTSGSWFPISTDIVSLTFGTTGTNVGAIGITKANGTFPYIRVNSLTGVPGAAAMTVRYSGFPSPIGSASVDSDGVININSTGGSSSGCTVSSTDGQFLYSLSSGCAQSDKISIFPLTGGGEAIANGDPSIAIGQDATANDANSIAIGFGTTLADGDPAIAIGQDVTADRANTIAIGFGGTLAHDEDAIAIGNNAQADGGIAIGPNSSSFESAIAIGTGASAPDGSSVAIGDSASAFQDPDVAIGVMAGTFGNSGGYNIGIGANATVGDGIGAVSESIAIGHDAQAQDDYSIVIGSTSSAENSGSVVIGALNTAVNSLNAFAIGNNVNVLDADSTWAIGDGDGVTSGPKPTNITPNSIAFYLNSRTPMMLLHGGNDGDTLPILPMEMYGGVRWITGTKPTCDSTIRGTVWYVAGASSVADTFETCLKDAADVYAWAANGGGGGGDVLGGTTLLSGDIGKIPVITAAGTIGPSSVAVVDLDPPLALSAYITNSYPFVPGCTTVSGCKPGNSTVFSLSGSVAISSLPAGTLNGLGGLTHVSLNDLAITTLPATFFSGTPLLTELNMHSNGSMTTFPSGLFTSLTVLQTFDAFSSALSTLPSSLFDANVALNSVDLDDNAIDDLGINRALASLVTCCLANSGTADLSGGTNAAPTTGPPDGIAAYLALTGAGWSVTVNTVTLPITVVNQGTKTFTVAGDQTQYFEAGETFTVSGSTGNDGTYTVISAVFTSSTAIVVVEAIPDPMADGNIVVI